MTIKNSLRERLKGALAELPVLPQAVVALMQLDPKDESYYDEVLNVVSAEPNFATRLLIMANSVISGSQTPVETLDAAFARIGSTGAASLVTSLSVTRVFVPRDDWEKSLWRHAIQVAIAARELARKANDPEVDPSVAYTCGLLHDIGRFVMLQEGPEALRQIDEGGWETPGALVELEKSICGLTHSELGASACERWKLPATICTVIREHHDEPALEPMGSVQKIRAVVTSADLAMFPSALPGSPSLEDASLATLLDIAKNGLPPFLSMSVPELRNLLKVVFRDSTAMTGSLGLC